MRGTPGQSSGEWMVTKKGGRKKNGPDFVVYQVHLSIFISMTMLCAPIMHAVDL